jgi:hypothetical protein
MKNWIIISLYVLAQVPSSFFGTVKKRNLALTDYFIYNEMTIDWVAYFYVNYLSFLLLAYCLHYNKGISKKVTLFILIVAILDMIHLMLGAMQGYGMSKIGTIIDVLKLDDGGYSGIDNWIKTLMALAGLIYFLITIPHKIKMQRLDRKLKKEQIEKLEIENKKDK